MAMGRWTIGYGNAGDKVPSTFVAQDLDQAITHAGELMAKPGVTVDAIYDGHVPVMKADAIKQELEKRKRADH